MSSQRDTIERLISKVHEETLKRGQVAAIKARTLGLHGAELRDALKTVDYYERALNRAVLDFYRGDSDAGEFIDEMIRLIEGQFERAWNEGSRAVGVDPKEHTEEDDAELQDRIDKEEDHVLDYAEAIEQARINGDPLAPLQSRVQLWVNRYNEIVNDAKLWFSRASQRFEWIYGDTQHCTTCLELNGIVATADAWNESGFQPQAAPNDMLECGGWKCQCRLELTKKELTEKQPGDVAAA